MIPHERSLVAKLADKPFALLGVNSDKDKDEVKTRLTAEQITWRHWFDGGSTEGPIASAWNVSGWPTTYVIDADGIIRFKNLRDEAAEKAIESLLAKMDDKSKAPKGDPAKK
jgi:peroxiredoxin